MLSQSVLLRGVNDDVETLGALMRALVECRIKPYYLHHADLAPGTAHFRTTIAEGQDLMRALHGRYSGLCQPAYVLDIPGGFGKSPIGPNYLSADSADRVSSRISTGGGTPIRRDECREGCRTAITLREALCRREEHRGLELITAGLARPCVAHAAVAEIFGPVGREQPVAALRAIVLAVGGQARPCRLLDCSGVQSHVFLPEPTLSARSHARFTLWHPSDEAASAKWRSVENLPLQRTRKSVCSAHYLSGRAA